MVGRVNYCWVSPAQSHLVPSPAWLMIIFYCLTALVVVSELLSLRSEHLYPLKANQNNPVNRRAIGVLAFILNGRAENIPTRNRSLVFQSQCNLLFWSRRF
jgi:hypothetical protein